MKKQPKSVQGEKEAKIFKRDKAKDERPIKAVLKGLGAKSGEKKTDKHGKEKK